MQKHSGEHKMEVSAIQVDQCGWRREERDGCAVCVMNVPVHSVACRKCREFDQYWEQKTDTVEYKF